MSSTRHTHPWVSTSLRRIERRKRRAHMKAKKSSQSKDWDRFKWLQSEVQRSTRYAHRRYMADVVSNDLKENTKRIWSFIKSKRQESTGVAPLINKEGYLHSDFTKKAEILNLQFQSVYTKENTDNIPDKGPSPFSLMDNIIINPNVVKGYLKTFSHSDLQALRGYQPLFLELQQKNYLQYWVWYTSIHLTMTVFLLTGERLLLYPCIRKVWNTYHSTTDLSP